LLGNIGHHAQTISRPNHLIFRALSQEQSSQSMKLTIRVFIHYF
jgi:hypothetical protein